MVDMKKKATDILEDYSNSYSQVDLETLTKFLEQIKAEAIKEFAERLKETDGYNNHIFDDCANILVPEEYRKGRYEKTKEVRETIENLVKEMAGDTE